MSQKPLDSLIGPQDSVRMMESLRRGATRRDILTMLMAGGMQATLAGSIVGTALSAHA
ncbi:MAG TPA: ABC transporter substrate-binding protein, partial [Burkholderiaceae bacterium]|nr:ABC transporter substrate-binding protein [Burkholderiaceae bacterium]